MNLRESPIFSCNFCRCAVDFFYWNICGVMGGNAVERAATKFVRRFICAARSFWYTCILVSMPSDKVVVVVVALAAVSLSTAVDSPLTECSSSTWSSNAAAYSERASYVREDYVGAGVGGSVCKKKGGARGGSWCSQSRCALLSGCWRMSWCQTGLQFSFLLRPKTGRCLLPTPLRNRLRRGRFDTFVAQSEWLCLCRIRLLGVWRSPVGAGPADELTCWWVDLASHPRGRRRSPWCLCAWRWW